MDVTGEILHGKTSALLHDGKGVYAGLPQGLPVTRYHSLAGTHPTLPECLEVSSWIKGGPNGKKGIIMGVRHRKFLVEGVQFHPESILTAEGRLMLRNFLHMQGGTWADNVSFKSTSSKQDPKAANGTAPTASSVVRHPTSESKESILDKIYRHRKTAIEAQKQQPGKRPIDLRKAYDLDLSPPSIPFPERLRSSPYPLALLAEIKRASPSKGSIAMTVCAPAQAREYALAGASVISVLTEPEWFKGDIEDLRLVRRSLEGMPNRPAVLRKEFIFDEYQILEARLAGADTVLLIVKMLDEQALKSLFNFSRELGMEPLVEINTKEETDVAIALGAQVIGVNNRNLTNFEVDLDTTSRLVENVPKETIICALSGISGPEDVRAYQQQSVGGVLIGEALMRASDVAAFVAELLGGSSIATPTPIVHPPLVKICGTRSPKAARTAIDAGADMIGMILVKGRTRCVTNETAKAISEVVHQSEKITKSHSIDPKSLLAKDWFDHSTQLFRDQRRALLVGVFQNQPLDYILAQQASLRLDIVQLHGSEPIEWASLIPVPVIRRFGPGDSGLGTRGYHALPLLDGAIGGSGKIIDRNLVRNCLQSDPGLRVILAGGLNATNVKEVVESVQTAQTSVVAVDVSSGVERDGSQDIAAIEKFVKTAKDL